MVASREIGWSTEANLYWQISKQLDKIIYLGALLNSGGGNPPEGDYIIFENGSERLTFEGQTEFLTFE